jgi:hypothetical protein
LLTCLKILGDGLWVMGYGKMKVTGDRL